MPRLGGGCHVVEQGGFGQFGLSDMHRLYVGARDARFRGYRACSPYRILRVIQGFLHRGNKLLFIHGYRAQEPNSVDCDHLRYLLLLSSPASCLHPFVLCLFPPWFSFVTLPTFLPSLDASCER